jgi:YD repeat-containing protein
MLYLGHFLFERLERRRRVTRELRADGVTATTYTYGAASGRLLTVTDPKQQVTTYTYNLDDTIASTAWTNAQIATPTVSYTYDTAYGRVATMPDGIGTTESARVRRRAVSVSQALTACA